MIKCLLLAVGGLDLLVVWKISDLDLHSGLHGDVGNLADNVLSTEELKHTLVNSHLETVVCVGTFTVGRLAHHELEELGGHAHGAVHNKVLGKSLVLEVRAYLLHRFTVLGSKGDADAVDLGSLLDLDLLLLLVVVVKICDRIDDDCGGGREWTG